MAKKRQRPYNVHDWEWEFLRRNARFKRKYLAIERAKTRFGEESEVHTKLRARVEEKCHLDYLACPDIPAHGHRHGAPVHLKPIDVITNPHRLYTPSDPTARLARFLLTEIYLTVRIDTRHNLEEIVSQLKDIFRALQGKGVLPKPGEKRKWLKKYKDYLTVWDLRKKGLTADKIASKLWPKEYEERGGRDDIGGKSPLIQKVYDHERAAQMLIDHSFPLPERHAPEFKK